MRGRVLIVDDDPDSGALMAEILALRDFDAQCARTGQECLDQLARGTFDVVVTDVRMPEMSGIELCRALRELHPDMLVIVFTGDISHAVAQEALAAGAYDFLSKPVKIAVLDAVLVQAISLVQMRREVLRLRDSNAPPSPPTEQQAPANRTLQNAGTG